MQRYLLIYIHIMTPRSKLTKEVVDAVVEIVRRTDSEEGVYHYGAVFIGMTDTDALKIDIYQIFNDL